MIRRIDFADLIYKTKREKYDAAVKEIPCTKSGQPVLVGTISIEKSEDLANGSKKKGSPTTCSTPSTTRKKPR